MLNYLNATGKNDLRYVKCTEESTQIEILGLNVCIENRGRIPPKKYKKQFHPDRPGIAYSVVSICN